MTPEPLLKTDIEQPRTKPVSVNTTLSSLVSTIDGYFGAVASFSGPVLSLLDAAAQPWLTLGAATPAADVGSPTAAGTASAFFVKGSEAPVAALVKGGQITMEDFFVPEWNYGAIYGDFLQADFSDLDFKVGGTTRTARP